MRFLRFFQTVLNPKFTLEANSKKICAIVLDRNDEPEIYVSYIGTVKNWIYYSPSFAVRKAFNNNKIEISFSINGDFKKMKLINDFCQVEIFEKNDIDIYLKKSLECLYEATK